MSNLLSKLVVILWLLAVATLTDASPPSGSLVEVKLLGSNQISLTSVVKNHVYPCAGVKLGNDNLSLTNRECDRLSNGYCQFSLGTAAAKIVTYVPPSAPKVAQIEVCLNVCGRSPISCEQHTQVVTYPEISPFIAVGSYSDSTLYTLQPVRYSSTNSGQSWQTSTLASLNEAPDQSSLSPPLLSSGNTSVGNLQAVACDSTGLYCAAIGSQIAAGGTLPYSEFSTGQGTSWLASTTQPTLAANETSVAFSGISCTGSTSSMNCTSVGSATNSTLTSGGATPFSFTSSNSGATWSSVNTNFSLSTPFSTAYPNAGYYYLYDVACAGTNCVAVGNFSPNTTGSTTNSVPISFNSTSLGGAWTSPTTLFPALPSPSTGDETQQGVLNAVACDSTSAQTCVAVGNYLDTTTLYVQPLAYYTNNGGASWSASTLPDLPSGALGGSLTSVACNSPAAACTAAGTYTNSAGSSVLMTYATSNSGLTWVFTTEQPQTTVSAPIASDIFCDADTAQICTLVGWYGQTVRSALSFYTSNESSAAWVNTSPSISGTSGSELFGVSCDSTVTDCVTVGEYTTGSTSSPLIFSSTDSGVSLTVTPIDITEPSSSMQSDDFLFGSLSVPTSELTAVTCNAFGNTCVAVGAYYPDGPQAQPFGYYSADAGGSWSQFTFPAISTTASAAGQLLAISCGTSGACSTVGAFSVLSNNTLPLGYSSTNGGANWTLQSIVLPGGGSNGLLNSVVCNSLTNATLCSAVGYYTKNGAVVPLSYTSSNGGVQWLVSSPLPTLPSAAAGAKLKKVTCDLTHTHCVAVGSYSPNSATSDSLPLGYVSFNGGVSWTSTVLPSLPSIGSSPLSGAGLNSVACDDDALNCSAVGYYTYGTSAYAYTQYPLTYVSANGGVTWAVSPTPPVAPTNARNTVLNDITCDTATLTTCVAAGSYYDPRTAKTQSIRYLSTDHGASWTQLSPVSIDSSWLISEIFGLA